MKARFRDSMTWLHTWSGLLVGWVLFAVFLTGTLAFFQHEITEWMQPELTQPAVTQKAAAQAQDYLQREAADANSWSITLPNERSQVTSLFWRSPEQRGFSQATLDGTGEAVKLRDSQGGYFLYRFHFDLHYMPVFWARWFIGLCSMFMLVAILTGVVIHKKIFKDFFTLQLNKGYRSWLDGHTVTSVLALPFHLMITYTGLVTLMLMYLAPAVSMSFTDRAEFFNALQPNSRIEVPADEGADQVDLQTIYDDARQQLGDAEISFLTIDNPNQTKSKITVYEAPTASLISSYRTLVYSATSGERLSAAPITDSAELTRRTLINLHAGRFADMPLRWFYFISGVMGTLMVATGLVLWFKKRQKKLQERSRLAVGHHLVNGLNAGFLMGLPLAVAAYFLSNRLLPLGMAQRADWEIHIFFATWAAMALLPIILGAARTWQFGSVLNALSYALLPIIGLLTLPRHMLNYDWSEDAIFMVMDSLLFGTGLLFFWLARYLIKRHRQVKEVAHGS